jgi:hypothetical protein
MEHHLAGQVLGRYGQLSQCPQLSNSLCERKDDRFREATQSAKGKLLGDDALEPLAIERLNGLDAGAVRRRLPITIPRPGQDLIGSADGEMADPLSRLDQPRKGTQERDLVGGVSTVTVGHAPRANYFVATFPRSETRRL